MADSPFGPWDIGGSGRPPDGPLAGSWFAEFAPVYEACATVGLTPREVDLLEPWEVAAVLGLHVSEDEKARRGRRRGAPDDWKTLSRRTLAARVAYARGKGPKPEPQAASGGEMALMQTLMRGG